MAAFSINANPWPPSKRVTDLHAAEKRWEVPFNAHLGGDIYWNF